MRRKTHRHTPHRTPEVSTLRESRSDLVGGVSSRQSSSEVHKKITTNGLSLVSNPVAPYYVRPHKKLLLRGRSKRPSTADPAVAMLTKKHRPTTYSLHFYPLRS